MKKFIFVMLLATSTSAVWALSTLVSAKITDNPLQFSITLNGANSEVKAFALHRPERIVVDVTHTKSSLQLSTLQKPSKRIKAIRSANRKNNTLRIVLDVNTAYVPTINTVRHKNETVARVVLRETNVNSSTHAKSSTAPKYIASVPKKLRDVVVVIDPGHGGKDPGAMGARKALEKDVVLAISKRLKAIIDAQPGMRAVLTRNADYYISLRQRLKIARKHDADIFVAIHADAFKNRQSNGASVFALSQTGATSEAARWLAEKENYSELGGVNLGELDDKNGVVRSVLIDLSQTATIGASVNIGQQILKALGCFTSLHHAAVEQARFVVLKSPDIPSVLVETGFISNLKEERNLQTPRYQQKLAQAIFKGINGYFWEFPPYGSRLEVLSASRVYMVKRGDTLSGIAHKHKVSLAVLQASNNLNNTRIKIGQKLMIPSVWA